MHDLVIGRSTGLTTLASLLHVGGLIGLLCVLPIPAWPLTAGLIGMTLRWAVRAGPRDVLRAQGQLDGEWTLTRRDGRREAGWKADPERSLCHPWLVILALRGDRRRRFLPIAADAVDANALRRLRVSLRAAD